MDPGDRFRGRAVLLTGAAGRLGRSIADRFEAEGARLCLVDRNEAGLHELAAAIGAKDGRMTPFVRAADMADDEQAEAAVSACFEAAGDLDILVNRAGAYRTGSFPDMAAQDWRTAFTINLDTVVNATRLVSRRWIGEGRGGAVVNLTSAASLHPRPGTAAYVTAKTALNGLTSSLAMELGPHDIRVNAIAPGMVLNDVHSRDMDIQDKEIRLVLESTPLGRTGRPQDIAAAVAFLSSAEADWITGAILPVTGGAHFGRPHYPVAG